jgi:diadenosine tetraphosphatase ApaH/serine/threonine PP2A family protein phosphatase
MPDPIRHDKGARGHNGCVKLALLADIHSNAQALEACLADARARGATQFAFLGDLVGYGADPARVVDTVMAMTQDGALAIRGNHDDAALAPPAKASGEHGDLASPAWTHAQLSPAQREFLSTLPLQARIGNILLVHASAHDPARWTYVTRPLEAAQSLDAGRAQGAPIVFGGHVHEQRLFFVGAVGKLMPFDPTPGVAIPVPSHREWLATVGSVGQPRDHDPRAMYAIHDVAAARLTFVRVPYDHAAAGEAIRRAGLPGYNAVRLARGE